MADGTERPVESIRPGDSVLSWDSKLNRVVGALVTQTFMHRAAGGLVRIDDRVVATGNHPVLAGNQWKRADELRAGDELHALDGARIPIARLLELPVPTAAMVYNLEVAGEHNYFAGGILVHNKITDPIPFQPDPMSPQPAYARRPDKDSVRANGDSADQQPAPASPPPHSYFGCAAAGEGGPSALSLLVFAAAVLLRRRR